MKKQRGLAESSNNNYKGNKEKTKTLLIILSVIVAILAITLSVMVIIKATDSKNTSVSETEQNVNVTNSKKSKGISKDKSTDEDTVDYNTIELGTYEQDNNIVNGAEPIKWRVLTIEGGKALVISEYGLDCKPYHEEYEDITWAECTLREWLNNEFYNTAFSETDKGKILKETIVTEDSFYYNTEAGEDTEDYVFLLNMSVAEKYFDSDEDRACKPTDYAVAQGANQSVYEESEGNCWWWLRSPGGAQNYVAYIFSGGEVHEFGDEVDSDDCVVRPALWIDVSKFEDLDMSKESEIKTSEDNQVDVAVGDTIIFGTYEQDNNIANCAEPIEWQVLAIEGEKALVISEYALDCKPYHEESESITWAECTLREWLNNEFYNTAFSDADKKRILNETIIAEDNLEYGTEAGEDTKDNVFLLSISEMNNYFSSDEDRGCKATVYAYAQGAGYSSCEETEGNCWWWLRSPGYDAERASFIDFEGCMFAYRVDVGQAVRPAMWIKL